MDVEISLSSLPIIEEKLGIVFRYSRANIYSYHALIGALGIDPILAEIPVFVPKPEAFMQEINQLLIIEKFSKLIVALSISTFQLEECQRVISDLNDHQMRDKMVIIIGGPHPSALPNDLLRVGADVVVVGEGERTFCELVTAIGNNVSFTDKKGIAYLTTDGLLKINPMNEPIDLDEYPPFAPQMELYSALEITR
ncbi:MAG: cobalamin-dependent protein [Candidatus Heimdallarchaeota archaeon]